MPLKRLVLLQVIIRTSLTLPTEEKNSSRSRALMRCDNCIQKTVRASLSSGERSSTMGPVRLKEKANIYKYMVNHKLYANAKVRWRAGTKLYMKLMLLCQCNLYSVTIVEAQYNLSVKMFKYNS